MTVNTPDTGSPDSEPDTEPTAAPTETSGLDRLLAGGRHVRLAILGRPPAELILPPLDGFERVAMMARPTQQPPEGSTALVADPLRLPFIEALFDRALVTSPLPEAAVSAELRELWRVLAPAGLALLVIRARRRWQLTAEGWHRDALAPVIADALFEVLDWQVETLPDRHHLILVGKTDGLRPALIGRVAELAPVTAPAV